MNRDREETRSFQKEEKEPAKKTEKEPTMKSEGSRAYEAKPRVFQA